MKKATITLILLGLLNLVFGQQIFDPKAVSTAGTYAELASGSEVLGWNPARLGVEEYQQSGLSFGLFPLVPFPQIILNNSTINAAWVNDNLFKGYFSPSDVKTLLDGFPDTGWKGSTLIQMQVLGFSTGRFALSIDPEVRVSGQIPKDLFRLALQGVRFDQPISLSDLDIEAQGVLPISIGYGMPVVLPIAVPFVNEFYAGVAVKPLIGLFDARTTKTSGAITSLPDRIVAKGDMESKVALGGFGLAADVGAGARIFNKFTVGVSLNNLIGSVHWSSSNAHLVKEKIDGEILSSQFDDLSDDSLRQNILDDMVQADTTYSTDGYTTNYPAYMNVSASYQDIIPNLDVMANYRQYFSNTNFLSVTPRVSSAVQYTPAPWFAMRLGLALGGYEGFQWGTGFGLQFTHYEFNLGFSQNGGLFNSAKGLTISIGQQILF